MKEEIRKLVEEVEATIKAMPSGPTAIRECYPIDSDEDPDVYLLGFSGHAGPWIVDDTSRILSERALGKFIAHARQDVPALCAAIREMDAENERLRALLQSAEAPTMGVVAFRVR